MKLPLWVKIVLTVAVVSVALILTLAVFLESRSPAYIYINDTSDRVTGWIIGGTSPGVGINLKPGEIKFVDMEFWWGEPYILKAQPYTRNIEPLMNFFLLKIVKISKLDKH